MPVPCMRMMRPPFLGIRLQGEKDIVVILSVYENYKQIMHEINMAAGLQTEAKGLILLPCSEVIHRNVN